MKRQLLLTFFVLSSFLFGSLGCWAESDEEHHDSHGHEAHKPEGNVLEAHAPKKKRLAAISYGGYMNNFRRLCEKIDDDGRMIVLYGWVDPQADVTRPDCKACKPLFRSLAQACKPPPVPKEKKKKEVKHSTEGEEEAEEAPPTPTAVPHTIKQREPHIHVLDLTSRIFIALSEDKELAEPTIPALQALLVVLRDDQNKTPAEAEYFSILAEYMEAPFKALIRKKAQEDQQQLEQEQEGGVKDVNPRHGLDDLF